MDSGENRHSDDEVWILINAVAMIEEHLGIDLGEYSAVRLRDKSGRGGRGGDGSGSGGGGGM